MKNMKSLKKIQKFKSYLRAKKHYSCVQIISSIDYNLKKFYYNTPLYDFIEYDDYVPNNLNITPQEIISGDPVVGKTLVNGTVNLAGQSLNIEGTLNWRSSLVSDDFLQELHSFDFLKDLCAIPRNQGRHKAIGMVQSWMDEEAFVDSTFWKSTILSRRLINFITYANWMFKECDSQFKKDLMAVILKQQKHLSKTIPWHKSSYEIIASIKGVIYAGLALPQNQSTFLEGLNLLKEELNKQILEDSTHIQKNAYIQFKLLEDLVSIRSTMKIANQQIPEVIENFIATMCESLAFFRHNDGKFVMFNSSFTGNSAKTTELLKICNQSHQTDFLPRAGFRKLFRNNTSIIVDCGKFEHPEILNSSTASTLAFELSYKNSRLFVSSGQFEDENDDYRQSKHFNTIEVDGNSSSEVIGFGLTGHHVEKVSSFSQEEKTLGTGIEGSYYGFKNNSIKHTRRIFLAENGDEIRGEDIVLNAEHHVKSFFHIHPKYKVKIIDSYNAEISTNGKVIANLKCAGGILRKKQAPIFENLGEKQDKTTIIISCNVTKKESIIRWSISFLD
ncbi:MAG: hypothetical protein GY793_10605 [Proteobacteria bacterium]|nr:hypothetical protein [Pseudomonadota bacterium]